MDGDRIIRLIGCFGLGFACGYIWGGVGCILAASIICITR